MPTKNTQAIILIGLCTIFTTLGQIFFKFGSQKMSLTIEGILFNLPFIIGLISYGLGAILLILSLRLGKLSIVYPLLSLTFIWVLIISSILFNEQITLLKILAILSILIGTVLVSTNNSQNNEESQR